MTGHVHVVRARLDDAGGDGADAPGGDELDADAGGRVDRAKVGDELCQVLDGVDVVVRRRADVGHARLASAKSRDVGRRLAAGQVAALAGLRALGDLDLELLRANKVGGGHAEAGRGDLLDPGVAPLSVQARRVPGWILSTLAGIGGTAGALHADRDRLVRLGRERADAHGGGNEASSDGSRGLDVSEGNMPATSIDEGVAHDRGVTVIQPAQQPRIQTRPPIRTRPRRVPSPASLIAGRGNGLQHLDGRRRVTVQLAVGAEARSAGVDESSGRRLGRHDAGRGCAAQLTRGEVGEAKAARPRRSRREAARDHGLGELECLELDASHVRGDGRDAHPGERLSQAGLECFDEPRDRLSRRQLLDAARTGQLGGQLDGQARVYGARAGGYRHRRGMDVQDVGRVDQQIAATSQAGSGQRRVDSADRQHGRDG